MELDDINFPLAGLFSAIGLGTYMVMLTVWSRMDFEISTTIKIVVAIGIVIAAFVFAKIYDD